MFLAGCSKPHTDWQFERIQGQTCAAIYTPTHKIGTLQFELLQGEFGNYAYLNVLSNELIKSKEVFFTLEPLTYKCDCTLLEGGQRLLLPEEATKMIVNALLDGQNVKVICEGFYTELEASGTSIRGSTLKAI